ncbi:MAG: D-alanyl-D-alanine carboxypeptidase/D-alanyl-D-alanine-endopeptidase, partial [Rhodocyclaceae bacterium]|nr:D-alanyl-D-alanine carboxypeptidase/D-alanyl-D-alanine-endopeptidase [Rhodocyclaceae bacterium]
MTRFARLRPAALVFSVCLLLPALVARAEPVTTAAALPASVQAALQKAQLSPANVAIYTRAVGSTQPTIALNSDTPMNPASVMKIFTAFAALDAFGPAATWDTIARSDGELRDDGLHGNLYLQGSGDPLLDLKRLTVFFNRLHQLGIERIHGDIVLDNGALALPAHDPGAFDQRPLRPYNSGPDGLLVHFNTLGLLLIPGARANDPVTALPEPALAAPKLDNQIRTGAGGCGTWYGQLTAKLEGDTLRLGGKLPAACGQRLWGLAPLSPSRYAAEAVRTLWSQTGGRLSGQVRHGDTPMNARRLLTETSPSLTEILREMNKWSSNLIARQLFALVGQQFDPESTDAVASARDAMRAILARHGVDTRGFVIDNGAGLSRRARASARTIGETLFAAWRS